MKKLVLILILFTLTLASCGKDQVGAYDKYTPADATSSDMGSDVPDVAADASEDASQDAALCPVQCSLRLSTPPEADQPTASKAGFDACRELSQEMCVDPGQIFRDKYSAVVLVLDKKEAVLYKVELVQGALVITVSDYIWTKAAFEYALTKQSL